MPNIETRYIGESRLTKVNFYADLESGQSVLSVAWTIESGSGITLVVASNDVVNGSEGVASVVRGRFDYAAANVGEWTLTAAATCTTPTEIKVSHVIASVIAAP